MSYLTAANEEEYKEALAATKFLGIPAEGFRKIDKEVASPEGIRINIKQNNSILYLFIKILQKIETLETKFENFEASNLKASTENPQFQESRNKLTQEISRIKISEKGETAPPAVTRKTYYFKNPQDIFESEKAKLGRSKSK